MPVGRMIPNLPLGLNRFQETSQNSLYIFCLPVPMDRNGCSGSAYPFLCCRRLAHAAAEVDPSLPRANETANGSAAFLVQLPSALNRALYSSHSSTSPG